MATSLINGAALEHELLHGLADPSRLRILRALFADEQRVSDIVAQTGLSQPNVSKHLACLRGCGLVQRRPDGREAFYRASDGVEELFAALERLIERLGADIASCELTAETLGSST
jgi:ArsR family transcriptional regulator, cadmium/lead-responsive transcriptional repressor